MKPPFSDEEAPQKTPVGELKSHGGEEGVFAYVLSRDSGRSPRWIGPVQWSTLGAWLLFSYWIFFGEGRLWAVRSLSVFTGVYAVETAFKTIILPNWLLVSISMAALILALQVVWMRAKVFVSSGQNGWRWSGRKGPVHPGEIVPTLGGSWCRDGRRWFFIAAGFRNQEGKDWLSVQDTRKKPGFLSVASPALGFLLVLIAAAFFINLPVRSFRRDLKKVYAESRSQESGQLEALLRRRPELRPYALYLSTIPACARADCLRKQVEARLEMDSIGPFFGAERAILVRLLILQGRGKMAGKFLQPDGVAAFELAVRTGNHKQARAILSANPAIQLSSRRSEWSLLLLEEGRYERAYAVRKAVKRVGHTYRAIAQEVVTAYMTGRCGEAERNLRWLYAPYDQDQATLKGKAPASGLGALQRAAKTISAHASIAIAFLVDGRTREAQGEWARAEALAQKTGIPGLLDRGRVLVSLLDPAFLARANRLNPENRFLKAAANSAVEHRTSLEETGTEETTGSGNGQPRGHRGP